VTHLDGLYYDEQWIPLPQEEFAARQEKLVAADRWMSLSWGASIQGALIASAIRRHLRKSMPRRPCVVDVLDRSCRDLGAAW
jgi:hypothetical protein